MALARMHNGRPERLVCTTPITRVGAGPTVVLMPNDAALTVTDLVVRFGGVTALDGVSFTSAAARSAA